MSLSKKKVRQSLIMSEISPIGYDIIKLVSFHRAMVSAKIRKLDLYPGQEMLLLAISEVQPCSQGELGQHLCLDHSTIATSVARMEKAKLIIRERSAQDRRVVMLKLTSYGNEKVQEIIKILSSVENQMNKDLSDKDKQNFSRIVNSIINNITD